jgi:hypothetical protein
VRYGESDVCVCDLPIFSKDKAALTPFFLVSDLSMQCYSRNNECSVVNQKKHNTGVNIYIK